MQGNLSLPVRKVFVLLSLMTIPLVQGCGEESQTTQSSSSVTTSTASANLALRGKQVSENAPVKPVFGMIWVDTASNRENIYDGKQWVPHDASVDTFYKTKTTLVQSLVQTDVCLDGDPSCTPTGAHGGPGTNPAGHYAYDCKVCHKVGGRLAFDSSGPAYGAGQPAPSFDATAKTCSNVACHGVPAGTFSYYFIDGTGEPALNVVSYGGTSVTTPSWYSGVAGCSACHPNPPRNGSTGSNYWHSGNHAGGPTAATNQCQFCHPDATGDGGIGTAITNPALHGDGIVQVQATFRSSCFGCH